MVSKTCQSGGDENQSRQIQTVRYYGQPTRRWRGCRAIEFVTVVRAGCRGRRREQTQKRVAREIQSSRRPTSNSAQTSSLPRRRPHHCYKTLQRSRIIYLADNLDHLCAKYMRFRLASAENRLPSEDRRNWTRRTRLDQPPRCDDNIPAFLTTNASTGLLLPSQL